MSGKVNARLLLSVGLLLVAGSFIAGRYGEVSDVVRGGLIGVGLALEVWGLGMMERGKRKCERM